RTVVPRALAVYPHLHSFPTRRSSDLLFRPTGFNVRQNPAQHLFLPLGQPGEKRLGFFVALPRILLGQLPQRLLHLVPLLLIARKDRKSTRLNSSHVKNSYAVFCLKKK